MNCIERVETYLRDNGVAFQVQHHPLAYTAQQVAHSEHVSGRLVAKVVLVLADNRMTMLVLPASHHVDLVEAADALGAQNVRLAHESEFGPVFADSKVGAEPAFGNLYDVPVYVDQALTKDDTIITRAGTHTDTLSLKYADFSRLVHPTIVKIGRAG